MTLHKGIAGNRYQKVNERISPYAQGMTDDQKERHNTAVGSKMLLQAMWAEHPRIMRHLGAVPPWA
jgi:hypothetical protein